MPRICSAEAILKEQSEMLNRQRALSTRLSTVYESIAELSKEWLEVHAKSIDIQEKIIRRDQYKELLRVRAKKRQRLAAEEKLEQHRKDMLAQYGQLPDPDPDQDRMLLFSKKLKLLQILRMMMRLKTSAEPLTLALARIVRWQIIECFLYEIFLFGMFLTCMIR